jgi:hypothetical protein
MTMALATAKRLLLFRLIPRPHPRVYASSFLVCCDAPVRQRKQTEKLMASRWRLEWQEFQRTAPSLFRIPSSSPRIFALFSILSEFSVLRLLRRNGQTPEAAVWMSK